MCWAYFYLPLFRNRKEEGPFWYQYLSDSLIIEDIFLSFLSYIEGMHWSAYSCGTLPHKSIGTIQN